MRPSISYDIGHIGFTYVPGIVSSGISYFERWNRIGKIPVTHTFIVTGPNECIEAHLDEGVARVSLEKYFRDAACRVYFRKPRGWTAELGLRIATSASAKLGARYDTRLIFAEATADTWLGHWLNRMLRDWPQRMVNRLFDAPDRWICSELVAYALAQQPEFRGQGVLRRPVATIDPQQLFEDQTLFEEMILGAQLKN